MLLVTRDGHAPTASFRSEQKVKQPLKIIIAEEPYLEAAATPPAPQPHLRTEHIT